MRTLLDTNLFVSYLLSSRSVASAVGAILQAAAAGSFVLIFPPEVAEEIAVTIAGRPDLAARIARSDIERLIRALGAIAESAPALREPAPSVSRDPKDDYLIAQAIVARADYLVSRDNDLLDLGQVAGVRIVSPPTFLRILRETGRLAE